MCGLGLALTAKKKENHPFVPPLKGGVAQRQLRRGVYDFSLGERTKI